MVTYTIQNNLTSTLTIKTNQVPGTQVHSTSIISPEFQNNSNPLWSLTTLIYIYSIIKTINMNIKPNSDQIRQIIAESGKSRIKDVVSYFKARFPAADLKQVREEARDLLKHLK